MKTTMPKNTWFDDGFGFTAAKMPKNTWFEDLFGFRESDYASTQRRFAVEGTRLRSLVNGRTFNIGSFSTPSLAALRDLTVGKHPGSLQLTHEAIGDVLELHAHAENQGAVFQAASQFNCLEFAGPDVIPEHGVSNYTFDHTQGPACALAAAAATVYRNYFASVNGISGQTRNRQINLIDDLGKEFRPALWEVRNGYTWSDKVRLASLQDNLSMLDRERLLGQVKIGLHRNVGVTFARRFVEPSQATHVTQIFCSAVSCSYSRVPVNAWEPLATMALDAAYEATLRAAVLEASGTSSKRVWLTFLGGGAFGNRSTWIANAIGRALAQLRDSNLDVRIAHYQTIDKKMVDAIDASLSAHW